MASPRARVRISRAREVRTDAELWNASRVLCDIAVAQEKGSACTSLSSILLTMFALEAYLNHLGSKLFKAWSEMETLSPRAKLEVILEKVDLDLPRGKDPIQTVDKLVRFRNAIAHGKTQTLKPKDEFHSASADIDTILWNRPLTDWEKMCTPKIAETARKQIEKLVHELHKAAKIKSQFPFVHGIGTHSAVLE